MNKKNSDEWYVIKIGLLTLGILASLLIFALGCLMWFGIVCVIELILCSLLHMAFNWSVAIGFTIIVVIVKLLIP